MLDQEKAILARESSFVERQNLTMRMSMRRFIRLTNGFGKKLENHEATGLSHTVWTIADMVSLMLDSDH